MKTFNSLSYVAITSADVPMDEAFRSRVASFVADYIPVEFGMNRNYCFRVGVQVAEAAIYDMIEMRREAEAKITEVVTKDICRILPDKLSNKMPFHLGFRKMVARNLAEHAFWKTMQTNHMHKNALVTNAINNILEDFPVKVGDEEIPFRSVVVAHDVVMKGFFPAITYLRLLIDIDAGKSYDKIVYALPKTINNKPFDINYRKVVAYAILEGFDEFIAKEFGEKTEEETEA